MSAMDTIKVVCVDAVDGEGLAGGVAASWGEQVEVVTWAQGTSLQGMDGVLVSWTGEGSAGERWIAEHAGSWNCRFLPIIAVTKTEVAAPTPLLAELGVVEMCRVGEGVASSDRPLRTMKSLKRRVEKLQALEAQFFKELQAGDVAKARAALDSLILMDPRARQHAIALARAYESQGKGAPLEELCQRLVETDPSHVKAWAMLTMARQRRGDVKGAKEAADRTESVAGGSLGGIMESSPLTKGAPAGILPEGMNAGVDLSHYAKARCAMLAEQGGSDLVIGWVKKMEATVVSAAQRDRLGTFVRELSQRDLNPEILKLAERFGADAPKSVAGKPPGPTPAQPRKEAAAFDSSEQELTLTRAGELVGSLMGKPFTLDENETDNLSFHDVLGVLRKAASEAEAMEAQRKAASDPLFHHSLALFHESRDAGVGFEKMFRTAGAPDLEYFSEYDVVWDRLVRKTPHVLVLWYMPGHHKALRLLRQWQEERERETITTVVLCPGDHSLKSFNELGKDLMPDLVSLMPPSRTKTTQLIHSAMKLAKEGKSGQSLWSSYRLARGPNGAAVSRDPKTLSSLGARLAEMAGKDYWATSQAVLHGIAAGRLEEAKAEAGHLVARFPRKADAWYVQLQAEVASGAGDAEKQAAEFLTRAATLPGLGAGSLYRYGAWMASRGLYKSLDVTLLLWHGLSEISRGTEFLMLAGAREHLRNRADLAQAARATVIKQAPTHETALLAYGKNLDPKTNPKLLVEYWTLADRLTERRVGGIRAARARTLEVVGQTNEAVAIWNELMFTFGPALVERGKKGEW